MLTKIGFENTLRRIMETGGLTDAMADDIQKLKDDFDEREGILNRYGESYDGEDEEYEWREKSDGGEEPLQSVVNEVEKPDGDGTVISVTDTQASNNGSTEIIPTEELYRKKYEDLKQMYIDRFFGGNAELAQLEPETPVADEAPVNFESLLRRN